MKNFSNPWGNKGSDYKRWYTNKWIEGGEYYDTLYANSNNENAWDGDEEEDAGPVEVIIRHSGVPADDPDYVGLKSLVDAADSFIPNTLKKYGNAALASTGDTYFTIEVFEEFDRLVKEDFRAHYFPTPSADNPTTPQIEPSMVIVIAWDFLAALRVGQDGGVTDSHGNSNTLARNYQVIVTTNFFGLPSRETVAVELYDAKLIADGGQIVRVYSQYWITLKLKNRFIFTNFTIAELTSA